MSLSMQEAVSNLTLAEGMDCDQTYLDAIEGDDAEDLPHELEPPPAAASQSACSMDAQ